MVGSHGPWIPARLPLLLLLIVSTYCSGVAQSVRDPVDGAGQQPLPRGQPLNGPPQVANAGPGFEVGALEKLKHLFHPNQEALPTAYGVDTSANVALPDVQPEPVQQFGQQQMQQVMQQVPIPALSRGGAQQAFASMGQSGAEEEALASQTDALAARTAMRAHIAQKATLERNLKHSRAIKASESAAHSKAKLDRVMQQLDNHTRLLNDAKAALKERQSAADEATSLHFKMQAAMSSAEEEVAAAQVHQEAAATASMLAQNMKADATKNVEEARAALDAIAGGVHGATSQLQSFLLKALAVTGNVSGIVQAGGGVVMPMPKHSAPASAIEQAEWEE